MHQARLRITVALGFFLALSSCVPREPTGPGGGAQQTNLLVRADLSGTLVATVVVHVSAPDIATPLVFNIAVANAAAVGVITVSAGSNRTITLRAYDAGGVQTHGGSAIVNIQSGTNPTLSVVLAPLTGDLPITVTLGSFSVAVQPAAVTLAPGDTVTLTASVLDASDHPVTGQVVWATLAPAVTTVVTTGMQTARVTAPASGEVIVVAAYGGVAASAAITVAEPTLVQHVSTPVTSAATTGLNVYLPNKSLAGNCLIVVVRNSAAPGVTVSVSDDQDNTYTAGPAVAELGGPRLSLFYALNARAGVQHITVSFAGGIVERVSAVASEWYNIALSDALDGSSHTESTSGTSSWASGNLTTSGNGDLVYQVAVDDQVSGPYASFTAGEGFALTSADLVDGTATQYTVQRALGVINPTVTASGSGTYASVAIALKTAAAGTAPGRNIRIAHLYVGTTGTGTATVPLQMPCSGNLLVFTMTGDTGVALTGIADGNGNSYAEVPGSPLVNGFGGAERMYYAARAACSSSMPITLTFASALPTGSAFTLYDIVGAAPNTFESASTATGTQTEGGPLATVSITPATASALVIARGDQNVGTITGLVGLGYFFDNPTWVGQDDGGPAGGAGANFTRDSQAGHAYALDATPLPFVWTATRAVFEWATIVAAFRGAF